MLLVLIYNFIPIILPFVWPDPEPTVDYMPNREDWVDADPLPERQKNENENERN